MTKICPKCQAHSALDAKFCPQCGHAFRTQFTDQTRLSSPPPPSGGQSQRSRPSLPGDIHRPGQSPTNAIVFAVLLAGGGQFANGQTAKGFVLLGAAIFVGLATVGLGAAMVWMFALIDAIQIASRLQRGETVGAWQFF